MKTIRKSILVLAFLISISQLQSCYTITETTDSSRNETPERVFYSQAKANGMSVVEGILKYIQDRETALGHRFILKDLVWSINYPFYRYDAVDLVGKIDSSFTGKYVLIMGTYQTDFGDELHPAIIVSFKISKIMVR